MTAKFSTLKLVSKKEINEKTAWMTFDGSIDAQPGQFVMVWLPNKGEKPFSIASMNPFSLLVVDVGPFSHALHQLKVNEPIWIKGPLGKGFTIEGNNLLMVGGGYGAAPLLPLATAAKINQLAVHVCLGARNQFGLLLSDQFNYLGCHVGLATEDGSIGNKGIVTQIAENVILERPVDTLYACGPTGLLTALAKLCATHQINYQLSWEAHMRCGMGLCGSCEVPNSFDLSLPIGWLACFDGPVFKKTWD